MKKKTATSAVSQVQLIKLLNTSLKMEYSFIVHYPRLASYIKDDETRKLVLALGTASISHADLFAKAITKLGGKPNWSFTLPPENPDLVKIFQNQLRKEEEAYKSHLEAASLMTAGELAAAFESMANEEKRHIKTVKRILEKLSHS